MWRSELHASILTSRLPIASSALHPRSGSPADSRRLPRGPGHTPNLSHSSLRPRGEAGAAGPSGAAWSSSSDEEEDLSREGATPDKWSVSSGTHDGSFKKPSPSFKQRSPHIPGESMNVLARPAGFALAGAVQRQATLAALSGLQERRPPDLHEAPA